jgi:hypothetical protein
MLKLCFSQVHGVSYPEQLQRDHSSENTSD